jgi:hypothetical protein
MASDLEDTLLWMIVAADLPRPEREFRFHPTRRWRFDFAWPDRLLAVEVMGGVWSQGRHTRGAGYTSDCQKQCEAVVRGWRILNVTGSMIQDGSALDYLTQLLKAKP